MQDSLTREEVTALIGANEKVATQLTIIAGELQKHTEAQQKIMDRLSNGIGTDMAAKVLPDVKTANATLEKLVDRQNYLLYVITFSGVVLAFLGGARLLQLMGLAIKP